MLHLVKIAVVGALAAAGAFAPHAFDRPLADITVESRSTGVRISMMMNFQFIDKALGISGDDTRVPSEQEIAGVRARLLSLFDTQELARIDGDLIVPAVNDFATSAPPKELRDREPQLSRKLTQIRFALDYKTPGNPEVVSLHWRWFPEHPLYDVPNSPIAPMVVNAVVLRGSKEPDVLKFTTVASQRDIAFEALPENPENSSAPLVEDPASRSLMWPIGLLLGAVGAGFLLKVFRKPG
jgi:hypothetical protein